MSKKTQGPRVCLSRKEAAAYCGITVMAFDKRGAPAPDVLVGTVRGWDVETIKEWDAQKSQRGPGRPRKNTG
ncbi:hypothetical protein [Curtobacterium sp. S6]|uniref:hypothetical protein n=1 Tax=Curtobacterium sp. S6 TaxID=1479623 RepID=UPI0004AB85A1|nr:hypothetical protein [Curtobacterium sp. S6]